MELDENAELRRDLERKTDRLWDKLCELARQMRKRATSMKKCFNVRRKSHAR